MGMLVITRFSMAALLFSACQKPEVNVTIRGQVMGYDSSKEYSIQILEDDHFENRLIEEIGNEQIVGGRVDFSFKNKLDFSAFLEVSENDTTRCILVPTSGTYLTNPVTHSVYSINVIEGSKNYEILIDSIKFELDRTENRMMDLNLKFINPVLNMENNYRNFTGRLDTLPEGGKLFILADCGKTVDRYEFNTGSFEISTPYRCRYLNLYVESRYGWYKPIKQYEIEKLSLNFD
jgi:hypothetical protein